MRTAVDIADHHGIASVSMRKLADELGVVPMALYKHVRNKEELLDGMVDVVVAEIDPPTNGADWKHAVRERILSARRSLRRHAWASQVIESRTNPTPMLLSYIDSMIRLFRAGGFSIDLTHHAMHAMGSRLYGFAQEVFDDSAGADPNVRAAASREMATMYPYVAELAGAVYHDDASIVGQGCDDQLEFELSLDLLLDGLERLRGKESRSRTSQRTVSG